MRIDCLTTFPHIFDSHMNESIMMRAQNNGYLEFHAHNLRNWTHDAHRTTDDYVYGGGVGLLMKCEPIYEAAEELIGKEEVSLRISDYLSGNKSANRNVRVIIAGPQGRTFDDRLACELSLEKHLLFICGHYEGLDERVYALADDVVSIGDYVLTSGELASTVIIDATVRKIPGVLGAETGAINESFSDYLLEQPQYTRPDSYRGMDVPSVLLSGNDSKIDKFNRESSIRRTWNSRPDLIERALRDNLLSTEDLKILDKVKHVAHAPTV